MILADAALAPLHARLGVSMWRSSLCGRRFGCSYSNVMATIAVFVSLGGASYAATELPVGSVGSKQLRHASVQVQALAFALGSGSLTDEHAQLLATQCPPAKELVGPAPDLTAPPRGGMTPGKELRLTVGGPGRLTAMATADIADESSSRATLELELIADREPLARTQITVGGNESVQVPIEGVTDVASGSHTVGLRVLPDECLGSPGRLRMIQATIIASALPAS